MLRRKSGQSCHWRKHVLIALITIFCRWKDNRNYVYLRETFFRLVNLFHFRDFSNKKGGNKKSNSTSGSWNIKKVERWIRDELDLAFFTFNKDGNNIIRRAKFLSLRIRISVRKRIWNGLFGQPFWWTFLIHIPFHGYFASLGKGI